MNDQTLDRLDARIKEILGLVSTLRSENAALKGEIEKVQKGLNAKTLPTRDPGLGHEEIKNYQSEIKRLQSGRTQVKQKIRNVLRKIEALRLDDGAIQKDLFDSE